MRIWDKSKPPTGPFALNKDAAQAQGLIAWYPMGGASKLWVPDYLGSSHLDLGVAEDLTVGQSGAPVLVQTVAGGQYAEGVISALSLPLSVAGWANTTSSGAVGVPICLGTSGATTRIQVQKDLVSRVIGAAAVDATNTGNTMVYTAAPGTYTDNVDFHIAAVWTSSASRQGFLNGVASAVDTSAVTTSGMNRVVIGGRRNSTSVGIFWGGQEGEWGVWGLALTAAATVLLADPGRRFELWYPLRNRKWFSAGGVLNCSVAESVSATDVHDAALTLAAAIAESITITDTQSAVSNVTRPNSDVTTTGWTASTGSDLYAMIAEAAASDADYITSPDLTSGASTTIHGLSQSLATGTYTVRFRSEKATAPARSVRLHLMDGTSTIQGSSSWQTITTSYTTYELSITTSALATRVGIEAQ